MEYQAFLDEVCLHGKVLGITRLASAEEASHLTNWCALTALEHALAGEKVVFTAENTRCFGASTGFGFCDNLPPVPGGFGAFLSHGRGEGFPHGEHVKRTPEIGEAMMARQPQDVMAGFAAIEVKPFDGQAQADTVTCLVNCDQLSALVHLFCFENTAYDDVIAPMVSGCASIFRIPFGELRRGADARAVIGNIDLFSRPHFPADTFFFTVPGNAFARMLSLLDESVLTSQIWQGIKRRMEG